MSNPPARTHRRTAYPSNANLDSDEALANASAWQALCSQLRERRAAAALGGSETARQRHQGRGKLLPRERVTNLLDPGSPFLEIGSLAAFDLYDEAIDRLGPIPTLIEWDEALPEFNILEREAHRAALFQERKDGKPIASQPSALA